MLIRTIKQVKIANIMSKKTGLNVNPDTIKEIYEYEKFISFIGYAEGKILVYVPDEQVKIFPL